MPDGEESNLRTDKVKTEENWYCWIGAKITRATNGLLGKSQDENRQRLTLNIRRRTYIYAAS